MNRDEWAAKINGREYREELSAPEERQAKADGMLIVFGASDDLIEFRGVIYDEANLYDGGVVLLNSKQIYNHEHECDCPHCGFKEIEKTLAKINCKWDEGGYSWLLETDLPHATFEIVEDGEKYCRGLVIDAKDLPTTNQGARR